jgi:putative transcriptional regulator
MNVKHTTKFKGKTDWDKVNSLSDEQIEKAAASDKDAPLLTRKELSEFKRVNPNAEFGVSFIRNKLSMTQEEFSSNFGINKRTLEGWEQHRKRPSETETTFLKIIENHGDEIKKMVQELRRFKPNPTSFHNKEDGEGREDGDHHAQ